MNKFKMPEYPQNLINDIFGSYSNHGLAPDILGTIEYCLHTYLNAQEREMINLRYKSRLSFKDVGEIFNVSTERSRQVVLGAVSKLRHPPKSQLIDLGLQAFIEREANVVSNSRSVRNDSMNSKRDIEVYKLPISCRTANCLLSAKIFTVGDILDIVAKQSLMDIRGVGVSGMKEIIAALRQLGFNVSNNFIRYGEVI